MDIVVPQLGESVIEARVARWLKREGETVAAGEPVVELETEKIDLEVGAEQAGVLSSIKHPEGADVKVGDVLAVVDAGATASAPAAESEAAATPAPAAPASAAKDAKDGQKATPTARKMAEAHDVALSAVAGSGDAGRITKKDVADRIQSPSPVAAIRFAPGPTMAVRRGRGRTGRGAVRSGFDGDLDGFALGDDVEGFQCPVQREVHGDQVLDRDLAAGDVLQRPLVVRRS